MGQVFTWDSIETGKIPKKESFHYVTMTIREILSRESAIVTSLLFGSVVRGDFNIRSDIDCLVIYKTEHEKAAMACMHEADQTAFELHVPINFTPCDTVLAQTRLHHFGESFVRHLRASIEAGGLFKGSLGGLLAPTVPAKEEIESYIKMKMYSMQESFASIRSFSAERLASFLKKALEASTHVGRKMLIYEGGLLGDSKRDIQERYRATMPRKFSRQLDDLLAMDSWYSEELAVQLKAQDEKRYRAALCHLQERIPAVLEFLRLNILRLDGTGH